MARNLSINGFALIAGQPHVFTIVDGTTRTGVVTRTGSNVVTIRQADGSTRELGQCSITEIRDCTDAEWLMFDQGALV